MIKFNYMSGINYINFLVIALVFLSSNSAYTQAENIDNLKYVDPQIGGVAPFLEPTKTRMHLPNSMVRMYPDRKDYKDDQIKSFPLTTRKHRSDPLFNLLPVSGNVSENLVPISAWDQELEIAHPYYYSTWLEDFNITLEFSPGEKSGFYRFNYGNKESRKLFLKKLNGEDWQLNQDGSLTGTESFEGMKAYAYGVFDVKGDFAKVKTGKNTNNSWITWNNTELKQVNFKYGISFISIEQAKNNLEKEIPNWDFDKVKNNAKEKWSNVLNQIEVEGGTEAHRRSFYTALYRSYERMVNITVIMIKKFIKESKISMLMIGFGILF